MDDVERAIEDAFKLAAATGSAGICDTHVVVDLPARKAEVARLAGLDPLDYDAHRLESAKRIGMRASTLDDAVAKARPKAPPPDGDTTTIETLEPWPDPVDGASLAEEIRERLLSHVVFSRPSDADAATLWVVGSYLMDTWRLWPRLMISSPVKQCGKSTLLEVIDALVMRGLIVSNSSSAGVFRAIEAWRPTLLFDEADTWVKENVELSGVLNSGHTRRTANVIRVVDKGGEFIPTQFSTWAAMVIAGIGAQRDTLTSRSVVIGLRRKLPSEAVERLPFNLHEQMLRVRRQLTRWVDDSRICIAASDVEPPECGDDRRRDNYTPLWRIAEALGGPWPARVSAAYTAQSEDDADEDAGVMMLHDLVETFDVQKRPVIPSADLVQALVAMLDRPWAEWRRGHPLTQNSMARLLKPFGIRPRHSRFGSTTLKGYHSEDVRAAFTRYCPPTPPASPETPKQGNEFSSFRETQTETPPTSVSVVKLHNSLKANGCFGVSVETPLPGGRCGDVRLAARLERRNPVAARVARRAPLHADVLDPEAW